MKARSMTKFLVDVEVSPIWPVASLRQCAMTSSLLRIDRGITVPQHGQSTLMRPRFVGQQDKGRYGGRS
jgi:hypothetical protein